MLNRWEGIGNLGKAPETRYTTGANPTAVCRFSIAVEKGYGDNKKTVWVNIVTFGKLAENCQKFLAKGRKVYAAGELDVREYDKQDGTRGYITEISANTIEFLSSREQQDNWPPQGYGQGYQPQQFITREQYEAEKSQQVPGFTALTNEEIPF
jgi:single-strand DNA-binding protein